jgi:hypothetical protein
VYGGLGAVAVSKAVVASEAGGSHRGGDKHAKFYVHFLMVKKTYHAEYDLELAEADGVDGLGHRERVVRHHTTVYADQGFQLLQYFF